MDKIEDLIIYGIIILLFIILIWFIYNYYHLKIYNECYDNSFKYNYCEKYKDY